MSIIQTTNVTKVYNPDTVPVHAVNGISLAFEKGEFSAIVGPSGCGKTTYLNLLGGLETPTKGAVHVDGQDISQLNSTELTDFRLHNIGFVFQAYNLIPVMSAYENVAFIMELQQFPLKSIEERVMELLEAMEIADKAHQRPNQLSGGQQQRVAVARALASRPKFILADEPTANLDSKATANLLDLMLKMNEKEETTFIFSTHDDRVMQRAKRLIKLEDGQIANETK
ncbi:putative ABC transport system ATP-binding protein [Reichenbachiella faecimaris]|uniref:Putative ABC transport system ATP-binding protein n=1 Tax=Reichenbachiella faecimaris TaxID=692418 RepID=A0A1W2G9J6_REIFA|nr:ABC transporter ATP-binding protein [Reichenbachiella faecimaris]SMD33028.1 putative ABC transport system ATP-binding protein [Reichenbachiella faecimaris]